MEIRHEFVNDLGDPRAAVRAGHLAAEEHPVTRHAHVDAELGSARVLGQVALYPAAEIGLGPAAGPAAGTA